MNKIELVFEGHIVENNQKIPIEFTSNPPDIHFHKDPETFYTIIMYDYDAPNPPFLHWLVIDVSMNNPGNEMVSYMSPNPPGTEIHTYTIDVFEQIYPISAGTIFHRSGFPLNEFINDHDLQPLGSINFRTGHTSNNRYNTSPQWLKSFKTQPRIFNGITSRRFPEVYNNFVPYFGHPEDIYYNNI